jgi:hypothetical protein
MSETIAPASIDADMFWRDGFATIVPFVGESTLDALRTAYDEILLGDVATDRQLGGVTRQVMVPSMAHPVFEANAALDAGREVMRALPHHVVSGDPDDEGRLIGYADLDDAACDRAVACPIKR